MIVTTHIQMYNVTASMRTLRTDTLRDPAFTNFFSCLVGP